MRRETLFPRLRDMRISATVGWAAVLAVGGNLTCAEGLAMANDAPEINSPADRPWELGVFYPFQYYQTQNAIGTSTSFTAVGLGVMASRTFFQGFGIMASYQTDLNAVSSAAIFSGLNVGAHWVFLGNTDVVHDSKTLAIRSFPFWRGSAAFGIGQRSYDFRTLISDEEAQRILVESKVKVELEGSGWAPFVRVQMDGRFFDRMRIGAFAQYQTMLPNAVQKTKVTSYFVGLTYDFSRLAGASE